MSSSLISKTDNDTILSNKEHIMIVRSFLKTFFFIMTSICAFSPLFAFIDDDGFETCDFYIENIYRDMKFDDNNERIFDRLTFAAHLGPQVSSFGAWVAFEDEGGSVFVEQFFGQIESFITVKHTHIIDVTLKSQDIAQRRFASVSFFYDVEVGQGESERRYLRDGNFPFRSPYIGQNELLYGDSRKLGSFYRKKLTIKKPLFIFDRLRQCQS